MLWRFLLTGPEDTPYACGCFIFDIYFPPTYPSVCPKVRSSVTFRFNKIESFDIYLHAHHPFHGLLELKRAMSHRDIPIANILSSSKCCEAHALYSWIAFISVPCACALPPGMSRHVLCLAIATMLLSLKLVPHTVLSHGQLRGSPLVIETGLT